MPPDRRDGDRRQGCRAQKWALLSTLTLLVPGVRLADDHDVSVATDDAAVVADRLDAGIDLHCFFLALAVFVLAGCREPLLSSGTPALAGFTCSGK